MQLLFYRPRFFKRNAGFAVDIPLEQLRKGSSAEPIFGSNGKACIIACRIGQLESRIILYNGIPWGRLAYRIGNGALLSEL